MAILRDATSEISYEQYAVAVTASLSGQEVAFGFPTKLTKFASDLKGHLSGWVEQLGLSLTDVLRAFLSRDVFNFLSKVGFNLSKVLKAVNQALSVVKTGLVRTFERIEKEGWLQRLQQGTAKIDELLGQYPLLKKLTGPVVAGLLIYMWFSMSFTGSLSYDMDLSHIVDALAGTYSIHDLLATPNGLAQMTLLVTGVLTGGVLSFPWLGASLANFILALLYTGAKKSNIKNLADKAKQAIQKKATVQANVEIDMNLGNVVARLKVVSAQNWEEDYVTKQDALYSALLAELKGLAKPQGYTLTSAKGADRRVVTVTAPAKDGETFSAKVNFIFTSLKYARTRAVDYRSPHPSVQGIQVNPKGHQVLFVTPDINQLELRTLAQVKRLKRELPTFVTQVKTGRYQHSGD